MINHYRILVLITTYWGKKGKGKPEKENKKMWGKFWRKYQCCQTFYNCDSAERFSYCKKTSLMSY
jgi:hypothetical protein